MTKLLFYSTPGPYAAEAARLRASAERLGLGDRIIERSPRSVPSWHAGTCLKPWLIRKVLREVEEPILYLDADAFLHRDPFPYFDSIEPTAGAVGYGCVNGDVTTPAPGTLWFKPDPEAFMFLEMWLDRILGVYLNQYRRKLSDMDYFLEVWRKNPALFPLPAEMCGIIGLGPRDPVIEHLQAGRDYSGDDVNPDILQERQERIRQVEATLTNKGGAAPPIEI